MAATIAPYPTLQRLYEELMLDSSSTTKREEYVRYGLRISEWSKADPEFITEDQVRGFFIELKRQGQYAPGTIRLMTAALRFLFIKVLGRQQWQVFLKLRTPDVQRLPFVLTLPQCQGLIGHTRLPHFRLLWELILGTGLRVSEAVALEVTSIRGKGTPHQWLIVMGKGNKERCIPLPPSLYQKLRSHWSTHRHPRFIFPSPMQERRLTQDGAAQHSTEPMRAQAAQSAIKAIAEEAGLPLQLGCHTLRHTYATMALEAGVNVVQVSSYLGHSDLSTTLIYLHLTPSSDQKAVTLINQTLLSLQPPQPKSPESKREAELKVQQPKQR